MKKDKTPLTNLNKKIFKQQELIYKKRNTDYLGVALDDLIELVEKRERQKLAEELIRIEKNKWEDAIHCSCLRYAIVTVFGEEYEDKLK